MCLRHCVFLLDGNRSKRDCTGAPKSELIESKKKNIRFPIKTTTFSLSSVSTNIFLYVSVVVQRWFLTMYENKTRNYYLKFKVFYCVHLNRVHFRTRFEPHDWISYSIALHTKGKRWKWTLKNTLKRVYSRLWNGKTIMNRHKSRGSTSMWHKNLNLIRIYPNK